jgi:hypothetical protein
MYSFIPNSRPERKTYSISDLHGLKPYPFAPHTPIYIYKGIPLGLHADYIKGNSELQVELLTIKHHRRAAKCCLCQHPKWLLAEAEGLDRAAGI